MEKLFNDLRHAAQNLVTVAAGLKMPLDTSTFEKALAALEDSVLGKLPVVNHVPRIVDDVKEAIKDGTETVEDVKDAVEEVAEAVQEARNPIGTLLNKFNKSE